MKVTSVGVWMKFVIAFIVCLVIRLIPIPFRAPNVEPIMATVMPFAKHLGSTAGFLFASLSIVAVDALMVSVGQWTIVTAVTYGAIGSCAPVFFKYFSGIRGYVSYAVLGTLVFDGITGVLMGPVLFGGSFSAALIGQIPFTAMHLAGNVAFAFALSPLLERWILKGTVSRTVPQHA